MGNYTEIVVLCEDKQQEVFIRRFLKKMGVDGRRIRIIPYPNGHGSGKRFVIEHYVVEVRAQRRQAMLKEAALIVMLDCDNESLEDAQRMLAQNLREAGEDSRQVHERIATIIPKWNIETWIEYLRIGNPIDEEKDDYPRLNRESECHDIVDRIASKDEYHLTAEVPSSLRHAFEEIKRIFPQMRSVGN